ncbi:hypothetical protein OUZ56_012779 [Daphnia magna]|uniref:Paraneoplastic antigen Ma-like C-terminal domain-containing protein n=1 Tax=Daphnia magna TaxID=35525 RepID=A0ABQ9Z460_9CRUS|nr:hypothetical protein OUZ56_012779 [Daphnia magna]
MSLYTGAKPKIFSKPIKSTVRHGYEPILPTFDNLTSAPVSKVNLDLSEPSPHQKRSTRSTVSLKTAKLLQLRLKNSKTIRKPKSFKWQDIKASSNSPSLLARTIHWLRQSPSTSDFENADSSEDSEQQEEIASNSSRHSPSLILGPRRKICTGSLNDIHQRFSSTPIPTTAPSQPCSRSRPNPPTSFKSPLTPEKPSGSSGSNTEHGTIHGTAAKSPHQTRRPAHFYANVIIRQHRDLQELQKGQHAQTMLIQPQNFTGGPSTRFDRWIKLFENIVAMSNWNEKETMNMLVTKMAGSAHDILQNILESVTQDYKEVKRLLQERFHGNENQDFFQTQLEEVKRHPGEAILDYGFRLKNIFEHGYPKGEDDTKTDETTRLQMLRQKFL